MSPKKQGSSGRKAARKSPRKATAKSSPRKGHTAPWGAQIEGPRCGASIPGVAMCVRVDGHEGEHFGDLYEGRGRIRWTSPAEYRDAGDVDVPDVAGSASVDLP